MIDYQTGADCGETERITPTLHHSAPQNSRTACRAVGLAKAGGRRRGRERERSAPTHSPSNAFVATFVVSPSPNRSGRYISSTFVPGATASPAKRTRLL